MTNIGCVFPPIYLCCLKHYRCLPFPPLTPSPCSRHLLRSSVYFTPNTHWSILTTACCTFVFHLLFLFPAHVFRVKKLKETFAFIQQLDKNMSNLRTWLARIESELSKPVVYDVCDDQEIQKRLAEQQVGREKWAFARGAVGLPSARSHLPPLGCGLARSHFMTLVGFSMKSRPPVHVLGRGGLPLQCPPLHRHSHSSL